MRRSYVYFDYKYTQIPDIDGDPYGILIQAVNVTEKTKSKYELQESQKKLRLSKEQLLAVIEVAKIGYFDWDIKSDIFDLNEQFETLFRAASGANITDLMTALHPEDYDRVLGEIETSIRDKVPHSSEYRLQFGSEDLIWIRSKGQVFYDDQEQPQRFIGVISDITKQKESKKLLENAKVEAEHTSQLKSAFLANISHELRTPLGAILGFSEILLESDQTPADQLDSLSTIYRNAQALLRLIDELLDLSKIEANHLDIEIIDFELADVMKEVKQLLSIQARDKGVALEFKRTGSIQKRVTTDPTRLRQILLNIIGNALKFTETGRVTVEVAMTRPLQPSHEARLKFTVKDTGIGLTPEQAEKIWEPFIQADVSTTRRFGGTGLGLPLSRRLAAALGGTLELVSSTPGQGSVFSLTIAVGDFQSIDNRTNDAPPAIAQVRTPKQEPKPLSGSHILLVEDSPDNQELGRRFLVREGAKVDVASDGEEGVEKALSNDYDLILMDIQMPYVDGYEATAMLRQQAYDRPIIALTAHAMKGERERVMARGFTDYIAKPISREQILGLIVPFYLTSRSRRDL